MLFRSRRQHPALRQLRGLKVHWSDDDAILEGCEWIRNFEQINPERRRIYRCIESLLKLDENEDSAHFAPALEALYGADTLSKARALLDGDERFFGQPSPGLELEGCEMHQRLLEAYAKLHPTAA